MTYFARHNHLFSKDEECLLINESGSTWYYMREKSGYYHKYTAVRCFSRYLGLRFNRWLEQTFYRRYQQFLLAQDRKRREAERLSISRMRNVFLENIVSNLQRTAEKINETRSLYGVHPSTIIEYHIDNGFFTDEMLTVLEHRCKLIRASDKQGIEVSLSSNQGIIKIYLNITIDKQKETDRLSKKLKKIEKDLVAINKKMLAPNFLTKAPQNVIQETQDLKSMLNLELVSTVAALEKLTES